MCNKTTLPMLHRARVVPLLSLCRWEDRPAASQPSSSAKMHWNTHFRTFPPSFGLPWGRVMGITGMFAPDYVPLFWEKCGLFCARGVNAENKIQKWRSNSIGCDSSPTRLLAGERYDLKYDRFTPWRSLFMIYLLKKRIPNSHIFSHSNFRCFLNI